MRPKLILFLFASIVVAGDLPAQADGTVDSGFVPPEINQGSVSQVIRQPDGKFLVAGDFTKANATTQSGLARFNADGSLDDAFAANFGPGFDRPVAQMALQSDGKIIACGMFASFNGTPRNGIARLNPDGTLDATWDVGSQLNVDAVFTGGGMPQTFVLLASGKIVVGGRFQSIGATAALRGNLARFNQDGTHDPSFNPGSGATYAGSAANVQINFLLLAGSNIYVKGDDFSPFDALNGIPQPTVFAKLDLDGNVDPSFAISSGPDVSGVAAYAAIDPLGKIYIAGGFTSFNGLARNGLIRLNSDGSPDATFDAALHENDTVGAIIPRSDGSILAVGSFPVISGELPRDVARLTPTGGIDPTFDVRSGASGSIRSLLELPDGRVVVAGSFGEFQGSVRASVAITDGSGVLDSSFLPSLGVTRGAVRIDSIVPLPDGKTLVAGFFSFADASPRGALLRLNPDGSLDPTFNLGGHGADASVRGISVRSDGRIWICGSFSHWNNVPRSHVARLNADGSLDESFEPGIGLNALAFCLAEQTDGKLLVAGSFATAGGLPRSGVARFNADGTVDQTFNPGTGIEATDTNAINVRAMRLQSDGRIVITGSFTSYNGTPKAMIARLNPSGSLDPTFTASLGGNGVALDVLSNDKIYVAGPFAVVNGFARSRIARLESTGRIDTSFFVPGSIAGSVNAIRSLANGKLYIGGVFQIVAGVPRKFIARLTSTGQVDQAFDPGAGGSTYLYGVSSPTIPGSVSTISTLATDGSVYVGGNFHIWAGVNRGNIVKLNALPYETWLAANFTANELRNAAVSGDTADADGDGIANLSEYAFNLNPRVANLPTGLPSVAVVNTGGVFANEITFTRRLFTPEISYIVETSGDLQTWAQNGVTQVAPVDAGNGVTQTVSFRDNTPLNLPTTPERFIRVRITRP